MAKKRTTKRTLSKAEKFYITNKCATSSLEEVSRDLECPESVISEFYTECLDNLKMRDTIDNLMIKDKKNGCTVMTKEASEKGEATRKSRTVRNDTNHIHKIRQG